MIKSQNGNGPKSCYSISVAVALFYHMRNSTWSINCNFVKIPVAGSDFLGFLAPPVKVDWKPLVSGQSPRLRGGCWNTAMREHYRQIKKITKILCTFFFFSRLESNCWESGSIHFYRRFSDLVLHIYIIVGGLVPDRSHKKEDSVWYQSVCQSSVIESSSYMSYDRKTPWKLLHDASRGSCVPVCPVRKDKKNIFLHYKNIWGLMSLDYKILTSPLFRRKNSPHLMFACPPPQQVCKSSVWLAVF